MERVKWEKPRAEVQAFVADDYVAVCYTLTCDDGDDDYYTVRQVDKPTLAKNGYIFLMNGWKPEWKQVFCWTDSSGYHLSTEDDYVEHKNVS